MQAAEILVVAITIVLWASAFPAIRVGLSAYSAPHLVLFRFLIASAFFAVAALLGQIRKPLRQDIPAILLTGFLAIAVYQVALGYGEHTVTAGVASMLINSAPIWTALMASRILNERLLVSQWWGIAVGFAGVALIVLGQPRPQHAGVGTLLVLLASLAHSAAFMPQKPLLTKYRPLEFAAYELWAGTLFLLPFADGLRSNIASAPAPVTWAVIYLGIGPAAIAYAGWSWILNRWSAARAASFLYFIPACAIVISWLWLGEIPTVLSILGGIVAIAGVAVVHRGGTAAAALELSEPGTT